MIDMLSAWGPFAGDEGCFPDVTEGHGAFSEDALERGTGDGSVAGDLWGWAATALAGAAAYAGVRRLLDRGRRDGPRPSLLSTPTSAGPGTAPVPVRSVRHAPPETGPQNAEAAREVAELVDELIALYDLEANDTLRRRIVRSLGKVKVRIDDEADVAFDADRHDVMGTVPAEAGLAPGTVVEVVRPGFVRADGQVVRAAEVVVAADTDGAW